MLSVRCEVGEEIIIGDPFKPQMTIKISKMTSRSTVYLVFDADKSILINRKSFLEHKQRKALRDKPGESDVAV